MKKFNNIYIASLVLVVSIIIFSLSIFKFSISEVSNSSDKKSVVINKGSISSISEVLKENDLIKSKFFFKLYVYITGNKNLKAATYSLSEDMGVKRIVSILSGNDGINSSEIVITFKEGINMRDIASIINKNTNNSEDDVYSLLSDKDYLNSLISKYWFLTDDILDDNIYYPLEGYLYPNTYSFSSKDVGVKDIFEKMLDEEDKKLSTYKSDIENSKKSVHSIITMASIVELEGSSLDDRKGIASVFYNRLNSSMNLGSDVTTYYGIKVNMGERDLTSSELSECNSYNTRCATFKKLPVGPICNPSIESINASINPIHSNYYYFVADKNKKIYFSRNSKEHLNTISDLKSNGLWFTY